LSSAASKYSDEAKRFVEIMSDLAPEVRLDYSARSLSDLDAFILKRFEPPGSKYVGESLMVGMGCYVGEVVICTIGGHWSESKGPEINGLGEIQAIYPIQKVVKRFKNGSIDSLAFYYSTVRALLG
jgi:hypothetical protein